MSATLEIPHGSGPLADIQFSASVRECVTAVQRRGVPFIAFGQTVFWDEMMKAVVCAALEKHAPDVTLIAGVHDTDYFSKVRGERRAPGECFLMPHDDGAMRELWAAIGETSSLFGAEAPVHRRELTKGGVPARMLAETYESGQEAFYEDFTGAYGWRGIGCYAAEPMVAADMTVGQLRRPLRELLTWGFHETGRCLAEPEARADAERVLNALLGWIDGAAEREPGMRLTDLYCALVPAVYEVLLGHRPPQLSVTASTDYFRFTPDTCGRPRFDALGLFLSPEAGPICREEYDRAVEGSGIYPLGRFGTGALPFDVVVPGRGRGTLHVNDDGVLVDLPHAKTGIAHAGPVRDCHVLAAALADSLGPEVRVVAKAVVLPLMFTREGCMLLHEGASVYVPRTQRMAARWRERGIEVRFFPIVRLVHRTWDVFHAASDVALPRHLARTFGRSRVSPAEFAESWRGALSRAREIIEACRAAPGCGGFLRRLEELGMPAGFIAEHHRRLTEQRRQLAQPVAELCARQRVHIAGVRRLREEVAQAEQRRGHTRRERLAPARQRLWELEGRGDAAADELAAARADVAEAERLRREQTRRIDQLREEIAVAERELAEGRAAIRRHVQSAEFRAARRDYRAACLQVARHRAMVLTDAHRTLALEHAGRRPSWWWFPAVDPSGQWFRQVMTTSEMRIEEFA
jgi:hypothetical protein